jgi:ADP-ribosyl-[dinitrogen reductase] hydrolase
MTLQERYRGAMLGLAVGDALGVPAEFKDRGTFPKITEMIGGGPFRLNPGEWTDDTTMALCLANSLIEKGGFDAKDQMDKYWNWVENGYMSSNGRMFDIGDKTSDSLCKYRKTGNPFAGDNRDDTSSGNGSLMRLTPIPLFYPTLPPTDKTHNPIPNFLDYSVQMSMTTHGSNDCILSCGHLSGMIVGCLLDKTKEEILSPMYCPVPSMYEGEDFSPLLLDIIMGGYKTITENQIKSTGYVLHTLEAALWCFYNTETFEDGLIKAVNLGHDSDTTGAVYGQLAGAYYGVQSIPQRWLDKTVMCNIISDVADKLYEKRKL